MSSSDALPTYEALRTALREAQQSDDGGLRFHMWANSGKSASGWGHPACPGRTKDVGLALPKSHPLRAAAK